MKNKKINNYFFVFLFFLVWGISFIFFPIDPDITILNRFCKGGREKELKLGKNNENKGFNLKGEDYFLEEKIEEEGFQEEVSFLFFGDLMLDRYVGEIIERKGLDYLLEKLVEDDFLSDLDLIALNLEGAVTQGGAHYPPHNLYDFAFAPDLIAELKKYNFSFFNLANNHLADQGARGIAETYQFLSELGFYYSGCRDAFLSSQENFLEIKLGEAMPPLSEDNCSEIILEIKGRRFAFLGLSLVYQQVEEEGILERIRALKERSDFLIFNLHFGNEYQGQANARQINLAHRAVEAGADLIIGHHPHVIQNYEIYQGRPIFYSLGNFIFDQYFSPETQEGLAVKIVLRKDKIEAERFIDLEEDLKENREKIKKETEENIFPYYEDRGERRKIDLEIYRLTTKGSKIVEIREGF